MRVQPPILNIPHGKVTLPAFLPDATFGQVRGLDAQDLKSCQVQAVMMNSYHLMKKPGTSVITSQGGLHSFSGWQQPIFTDSGGFQAYSLIRRNSKFGSFSENGIIVRPEGTRKKILLTPEKSIQLQFNMGADVLFCLDDCTHVDEVQAEQEVSVARTITWARRCKQQYLQLIEQKETNQQQRPKLFAVVQGGGSKELRKKCAQELLEIGFDGYGYGGWPLDGQGNLLEDIIAYTRDLIPQEFPMHALGIGHPYNAQKSYRFGYDLFDCAMPTRDARHGRLYRFKEYTKELKGDWLEYVYIKDQRYIRNNEPISSSCDCITCQHNSLAYLNHLYKLGESLYIRLATIHNLRFMTRLMAILRGESA
ncbi:MAG TPA: tRNA guanosine(34) transglycosylase Tgt [Anaerolineae bacterium]|nr:tRNA guanosine(34) transglycosylase Tgt [Anaerolineae bacterium]